MKLPTTYSTKPPPKLNKQYYFANINEALYVLLWIRSCYMSEWRPGWNSKIYKINMIQNPFIWTKHFDRTLLSHSQLKWRRLMLHCHWLAKSLHSYMRNSILNLQKLVKRIPSSSDINVGRVLEYRNDDGTKSVIETGFWKIAYLWSVCHLHEIY
jgi:hypothetical protein